jgi:hypothetical protein
VKLKIEGKFEGARVWNMTTPEASNLLPNLITKNFDGCGITTDPTQPDLVVPGSDYPTFDELIHELLSLGHEVRIG